MESLVDKYLNLEHLNVAKIQHISYLTGLSMDKILAEMDLGNFLITQIDPGKWVFLSEDKVGSEISWFEFQSILIANRFLKDQDPQWPRAEMMPEKIPGFQQRIVLKIDTLKVGSIKHLREEIENLKANNPHLFNNQFTSIDADFSDTYPSGGLLFVQNGESLPIKLRNKERFITNEEFEKMNRSGISKKQIVEKIQSFVDAIPKREPGSKILFDKKRVEKESFEHLTEEVLYRMKKMDMPFMDALWSLIHERDQAIIQKMEDQMHENIMKRAAGDFTPSETIWWMDLSESASQERTALKEFTEKIGGIDLCGSLIDQRLFLCGGMEGYNAGKALQDALLEASRCLSVAMNDFGETTTTAVDSVERISEMMNILKKQEPVDQYPRKHLSPKEFGMSLKRNQRRNG